MLGLSARDGIQIPEPWAGPTGPGGQFEKMRGTLEGKLSSSPQALRAQTPSLHPSNHAACFYSRDATGQ